MPEPIPVSAVVMTLDEERNLAACLGSLAPVAEVFVVDSGSRDRTRAVAEEHGARVVEFAWDGRYPKKKQWCLESLPFSHDWVLYVDADERLTPELAAEIGELLRDAPRHAGYFARLDYVFLGRVLRHGHRHYKLALLDRRRARFLDRDDLEAANAGEVELHYQPVVEGTTGTLRGTILHEDYEGLYHWVERHNRYSDWEAVLRAKRALRQPVEPRPAGRRAVQAAFDRAPAKGLVAFLHSYVLRAGFLDGRAGFHFALARAFYYWQVGLKTREARS